MAKKPTKDKTGRLGLRIGNPNNTDEDLRREAFRRWVERENVLKEVTDSPIELSLASAVAYLWYETLGFDLHIYSSKTSLPPTPLNEGLSIITQFPIDQYRADFYMVAKLGDVTTGVVVECDGHEFHERTKDQAKRDRSRDRAMALKGLTVIRFTGSEIHKDVADCAEEVLQHLGIPHVKDWK